MNTTSARPSPRTVHVWRMVHGGSDLFAPSDDLVDCVSNSVDEARTRAGWAAMSPAGEISATYLGEMTPNAFNEVLVAHRSGHQVAGDARK